MPTPSKKQHSTEQELTRLSVLVSEFTSTAKGMIESNQSIVMSNQAKIDLVYDFLFVGKPHESPPVPSFVSLVQRNAEDINSFKGSLSKLIWILVGLAVTGAAGIAVAMYNNFIAAQAAANALTQSIQ